MTRSPIVLIVEDHADTAEMYATALSQAGFHPVLADDGLDGLTLACEVSPDVVITELVLSGPMDGLTFARRLRDDHRTCATAIIVIAAHVSDDDRKDAERAGTDSFLGKPCLPNALISEVRSMLSLHRARRGASDAIHE